MISDTLHGLAFRCPACGASPLSPDEAGRRLRCPSCDTGVPVVDGRPVFRAGGAAEVVVDPVDRLKHRFKRHRRLYAALVWLVSPQYFDGYRRRFVRRHVEGRDVRVLNLGAGNTEIAEGVVNLDINPYDRVHVVADATALPFADASFDVVMSLSMLEHVPHPEAVVAEARRVLRPGGLIYTDVPFMAGFHASPFDYTRWTREGVRLLHRDFETVDLVNHGGPTSALVWTLQEWLALVLSLGLRPLHTPAWILAMLATFPLKFLDVVLRRHPLAHQISSCFVYVGRKPDGPGQHARPR